ncbi:MAG: hypothetical protein JXB19_10430 [Bacteroidales bacterium]|nr:hypothetical protein [Bacteroidales bacterium]
MFIYIGRKDNQIKVTDIEYRENRMVAQILKDYIFYAYQSFSDYRSRYHWKIHELEFAGMDFLHLRLLMPTCTFHLL